jgi:hypothetical protein
VATAAGTSNEITVAGSGSETAALTISLPSSLTFTGKTVTGGTYSGPTLSGTVLGTYTLGGTPTFPSSVTLDTEWDTVAEINAATTDDDFATLTGLQSLSNKTLASPVLSGTVTGTYTIGGTPTFPSAVTLDTEWDTAAEINAATSDDDFLTLTGVQTVSGAKVFSGINTNSAASITTANAMAALAIDTTKGLNTKSVSVDSTFTFSGAPATANTWFSLHLTNTDTNPHAITIPSSFSVGRQAAITAFTIPASGQAMLTWRYDGSVYKVFGDVPALDNFAGTAAPTVNEDTADGYAAGSIWLDTTNHHSYQCENPAAGAAVWLQLDGGSGSVSDTAFASSWNGVTTTPPSEKCRVRHPAHRGHGR